MSSRLAQELTRRVDGFELPEPSPTLAGLQDAGSSLYFGGVADDLVAAACTQPLLADFVIAKAAGDLLPADILTELAMARRLFDADRPSCPELDRRRSGTEARVRARPDAARRLRDLCPGAS